MSAPADGPLPTSLSAAEEGSLAADLEQPSAWKRRVQRRKEKAGLKAEKNKSGKATGEAKASASAGTSLAPPAGGASSAAASTSLPKQAEPADSDDDSSDALTDLDEEDLAGASQVEPLRKAVNALREKRRQLDNARADLEANTEQLNQVRVELVEEREDREGLESAVESLRAQIGMQVASSESMRKTATLLREELAAERAKNKSLQADVSDSESLRRELAMSKADNELYKVRAEKLTAGAKELRGNLNEVVAGNKFLHEKYNNMKVGMEETVKQLASMQVERDDLKQKAFSGEGAVSKTELAAAHRELEEIRGSQQVYISAASVKFEELRRLKASLLDAKAEYEAAGRRWSAEETLSRMKAAVDRVEAWAIANSTTAPPSSAGKQAVEGEEKEKKKKKRRKEKTEDVPAPAAPTELESALAARSEKAQGDANATSDKVVRSEHKERSEKHKSEHKQKEKDKDKDRERKRRRDSAE